MERLHMSALPLVLFTFALLLLAPIQRAIARVVPSDPTDHYCTKEDFDVCEHDFQANAMSLVEHKGSSRFNAWCSVLQAHEYCLMRVLSACRHDGYIKLSSRIALSLSEVVNRGCTHRGKPFHSSCDVQLAASSHDSDEQQSLLKMAERCLKQQQTSKLDGSLDILLHQLQRLTRDMQHLYNRLPKAFDYYEDVMTEYSLNKGGDRVADEEIL